MASEIYTRDDSLDKYNDKVMEVNDDISLLVIQIENILFTNKRDVLGAHTFGSNLNDLLFSYNSNENIIKKHIMKQISSYCPLSLKYNVNIDVKFSKSAERDIALIDIIIEGDKYLSLLL